MVDFSPVASINNFNCAKQWGLRQLAQPLLVSVDTCTAFAEGLLTLLRWLAPGASFSQFEE
jgi:hypothetical protein